MATRRSERRARASQNAEGAAPIDPSVVTDTMIRDAEDRLGKMQLFALSPEWAMQFAVLTARAKSLDAQREGLLRRAGRPATDQPVVTLEQITRIHGAMEQNAELMKFPEITMARWREEIRQMRDAMARQVAG